MRNVSRFFSIGRRNGRDNKLFHVFVEFHEQKYLLSPVTDHSQVTGVTQGQPGQVHYCQHIELSMNKTNRSTQCEFEGVRLRQSPVAQS